MRNLGAREALNLDGGTSTTMVLKGGALPSSPLQSNNDYCMLVGRDPETQVKSTLCLLEQK
jgi:exopolysaccharide biosynthesis protein